MDVREKLVELLAKYFDIGDSYAYNLTRVKSAFACGTIGLDDFEEFDDETVEDIASYLIANGVTVQEWISVKDRLPDNKEYDWVLAQVVENNGFMHIPTVMEYRQSKNDWFEETYGWLSEHNGLFTVTHWMPLPEPPKGE